MFRSRGNTQYVMAGLVPAPHALLAAWLKQDVGARHNRASYARLRGLWPGMTTEGLCGPARNPTVADTGLLAGQEVAPGAVGADAELIEDVAAAREHLLIVGAGDHAEQVDLLGRGQRLDRRAREIGPEIGFLRRAGIDAGGLRLQNADQDRENLDTVGIRIGLFPIGGRILPLGVRERRHVAARTHQ